MASEHDGWLDRVTTPPAYETLAVRRGVLYGRRERVWRLPTAVAVLGLGLATAGQFGIVRPNVERQIDSAATAALVRAGFGGMQVEVQGRDVTLDGTLPSKSDIPRAISLVQDVEGVRVIKEIFVSTPDATTPPAPSASARTASASSRAVPSGAPAQGGQLAPVSQLAAVGATIDGGTVTLVGAVPTEAARTELVQKVGATFGPAKVVDQLTVDPAAGGYGLPAFATVVSDLGPRAVAGAVAVHAGRMSVAGAVPDDAVHKAIAAAAVGAVGPDPAALSDTLVSDPAITTASDALAAAQLGALPPIPFADADAGLTPTATRIVGVAAAILLRHPKLRMRVEGHTDANGDPAANLRLSQARAAQVVLGLQAAGVPGLQLSAFGFGSTRPLATGTGPLADALNRRVVLSSV